MRVLVIEQGGRGGVADYTAALASALAADGARVDLATARDQTSYRDVPEGVQVRTVFRYVRDASPIGRLVRRARLGRVANGLLFVAAIPRLAWLARRADVVHTEGWEDLRLGVLAVGALRAVGATVVQTEHNTFEREASLERTRKTLARMTARTIVHTESDLPRAYATERGAVDVIPHGEYGGLARTGGDGDRARARAALGVPVDAPAVLLFGQLRSDKGLGDLLGAALEVEALHVIVAGEDLGAPAAERDAIAALGSRLHLRAEFIPMSDAADLFAAADAVVLPYKRASQSGVLLLAYGFGRPVVAYPVGGLAEAVEDGETGWLSAAPSPDALAEALRAVVAAGPDEAARRGANGRELAETRFAWDAIARRTRDTYAKARGEDDAARRTARVVFARELADGVTTEAAISAPDVLAALRTKRVPPAPVRFKQLVQRRRGGLDFASAVAAPLQDVRRSVLGAAASAPPRFLVRVDEFPHYQAWDEPGRFGTDRYQRFHTILTEAGVPYCIAVPTRVSRNPLDPQQREWRPLDDSELAMLQRLQQDGVTLALHGRDHRTRFASPRRRSELSGLDAAATAELLDTALAELAAAGLERPRVFVPPYNRFDATQYAPLAARFDVVCSGPETLQTMGFHSTPQWRDGALYLPSYWPLYGHAREVLPAADALIAQQAGLWAPITLHWGWESDDGWTELEALVARIAATTAHWDELLAAIDAA
ncbi:glycosyltransferase [Baekduia sp. Peel2402]|uniref:glycosyltransferase n=1 Tax=Baekduia sp. Peel2402 TaxID=3458296 RepID=UPI00403EE47A